MPDDDKARPQPGGFRQVFETADGGAYVESAPGAGPRGHDDLPLTPAAVERKARGGDPTVERITDPVAAGVPGLDTPGPGSPYALLVIGRNGVASAHFPGEAAHAHEWARAYQGVVVAVPVLADYRESGDDRG